MTQKPADTIITKQDLLKKLEQVIDSKIKAQRVYEMLCGQESLLQELIKQFEVKKDETKNNNEIPK